jgi:hypothetical protein
MKQRNETRDRTTGRYAESQLDPLFRPARKR